MQDVNVFDEIRTRGLWPEIFTLLCGSNERLMVALERAGRKGHVWCPDPTHNHDSKSFRFFPDTLHSGGCGICTQRSYTGVQLVAAMTGWDQKTVAREVAMAARKILGLTLGGHSAPPIKVQTPKVETKVNAEDAAISQAKIDKLWGRTLPMTSATAEPARLYLEGRGIRLDWSSKGLSQIRFHPALYVRNERGETEKYPGIVVAFRKPAGSLTSIHKTLITPEGKKLKSLDDTKLFQKLPDGESLLGSCTRIGYMSGGVAGVAEGLETALSVYAATKIPCDSTTTAACLAAHEPRPGTKLLLIWADKDRSNRGLEAALTLAERMAERNIKTLILMPQEEIPEDKKGVDWNDVLQARGLKGFSKAITLIYQGKVALAA